MLLFGRVQQTLIIYWLLVMDIHVFSSTGYIPWVRSCNMFGVFQASVFSVVLLFFDP